MARRDLRPALREPRRRTLGHKLVSVGAVARATRVHVDHAGFSDYLGAAFLGEEQVILVERILRVESAAHHAAAAPDATRSGRTFAVEIRIGVRNTRRA